MIQINRGFTTRAQVVRKVPRTGNTTRRRFFFVPRETRDEIKSQDVKDSRSTQEEKREKKTGGGKGGETKLFSSPKLN